jgi:holo-[acyl-carrier protein] synthase
VQAQPRADRDVAVGVDIVGVERVARLLRENAEFEQEVFTADELAWCGARRRRLQHLAARFAAKEAVLKAIGSGVGKRMRWTDVEVVADGTERPAVRLHGEVARWAESRGLAGLDLSLAQTADVAVAQAVAVWER